MIAKNDGKKALCFQKLEAKNENDGKIASSTN
jgi:hypothetical protein